MDTNRYFPAGHSKPAVENVAGAFGQEEDRTRLVEVGILTRFIRERVVGD